MLGGRPDRKPGRRRLLSPAYFGQCKDEAALLVSLNCSGPARIVPHLSGCRRESEQQRTSADFAVVESDAWLNTAIGVLVGVLNAVVDLSASRLRFRQHQLVQRFRIWTEPVRYNLPGPNAPTDQVTEEFEAECLFLCFVSTASGISSS